MPPRLRRLNFWIEEDLHRRAKQALLDRNMSGGVARLVREALVAYLAELDKIPLSFEATFRRTVGREPLLEDRWDCYGAREPRSGQGGPGISQRFSLTELEEHCIKGRWDERTAELIAAQRSLWLAQDEKFYRPKMRPPGWEKVQGARAPAALGEAAAEEPYEPLE